MDLHVYLYVDIIDFHFCCINLFNQYPVNILYSINSAALNVRAYVSVLKHFFPLDRVPKYNSLLKEYALFKISSCNS